MPITETVTIKAAGSGLMRTIGFPLKESFNVTDVSLLRLKDGATTLAATFTVGVRWGGLPSNTALALKWVHVTFKDTGVARNLTVDDSAATVPAQTNPLVVTNNANDITVSNGLMTAIINKTSLSADLLTSFQIGASEILHATNKPQISVPVPKKTITTWTSGSLDFAATPSDSTVKVANASLFAVGETLDFEWEGTVGDYYPTGGDGGRPFIIMAAPFTLPDMTRALMDSVHQINIIIDYGGAGQISVPIDYSQSQGFCLESVPATTPTIGMKIRIVEVEAITTKTIQSINPGANTITFTSTFGQYLPQGIEVIPTVAGSSTAHAVIVAGNTIIEKQYGDKAVILKQRCHLYDGGSRLESNLTFDIRYWFYADTGFFRQKITQRNIVEALSTNACPPVFFSALDYDFPTAIASSVVSDSVLDMTTSVTRYKANNLHVTLTHSAISNFQFAVHEFQVQWPNIVTGNATGFRFEIFPAVSGPTKLEGGIIKSRDLFIGTNAGQGLALLDNLGASFDGEYIALSKAVRPNMVEKRDWNTFFAAEPQKLKDACARFERQVACLYDITQAEPSFGSRPAMSLYEYRWDYPERAGALGSYPFGWDRWGNTPDDVGFGNNRFDLPYILFREGLRENTTAKAELAFRLGLQQIRNRAELGQMWNHQSQAGGTPDMYGLARYERAYAPDPFNYTNSPIATPTHSWNEGTCLAWALTDDPILYEAAKAGVEQARQYNYQGTANALLYGTGANQMGTLNTTGGSAEPRFVGWPIHTLVTGYRYFGEAIDLQRAQEYTQSFLATMATEPVQDGFIDFRAGGIVPLFQHGGYCVMGMIETWRESVGATKTAIGDYIDAVAKFLQRGDAQSIGVTANAPMLTGGKSHPTDNTKYLPASHMPFSYTRSYADTLSAGISASATTIPVNDGATFNLNLNFKRGVLIPAGQLTDPTTWEYFTYTGVSGNNLTGVTRGFSGSGAKPFNAGDIVYPTAFNNIENDLVIATLIMGARISGDTTLQQFAQTIWEDNCLYSKRVDGGNPDFVTVGNYQPINTWPLNVSSNGLKTMAQAGLSLSEFLGDRVNPPDSPTVTSINPTNVNAGAAQFTLTVNGTNFANDAQVRWNGTTALVTSFVSATQVTAVVPASLVTTPGTALVTVRNVTDNLTSNSNTFTINALPPTITSLFPDTKVAGEGSFVLIVNGTNFAANSTVTINGVSRTTTFVSAVRLDVQVLAADIATAGAKPVVVTNPTSGLSSTASNLTVTGGGGTAPTVTNITPSTALVGTATGSITITGTNLTSATVTVDGNAVIPTTNTATQIVLPSQVFTTTGTKTVVITTANGSANTSISVNNPVPVLTSISPTSVTAGAGNTTITLNGSDFVAASVARAGATGLTTTYVSPTQLTAVVPSSLLTTAGTLAITVLTVSPGGGTSGAQTLTINAAPPGAPTITSISPASLVTGSAQQITINGTNLASATVAFQGVVLTPTLNTATQIVVTIPSNLLTAAGNYPLDITTAGGTVSQTITVNSLNLLPSISSINPSSVTAGVGNTLLSVTGQNFDSDARILFDGQQLTTTFVSSTNVTATIPSNLLTTAGTRTVAVLNVAANEQTSNTTFTINAGAAPSISTLSPSSANAGGAQFTLTVNGTGFQPSAIVRVNGTARATTFVSATQVTATILAADISAIGTRAITVLNPDSQVSNTINFPVNALAPPTISSLSPALVTPGAASFVLAVIGTNFTENSQIQIDGTLRTTTWISATRLETIVGANEVVTAGTLNVAVVTAGVGTSATVLLPVQNFALTLPNLTPEYQPKTLTLRIQQGKTFLQTIPVEHEGFPLDLTGVTARLQLRRKTADEERGATPILELNTTNGGLQVDIANSEVKVNLTAVQTQTFRFRLCRFEIEATTPEGIVVGLAKGDVRITGEFVR
jgi:IPT/TIG domain